MLPDPETEFQVAWRDALLALSGELRRVARETLRRAAEEDTWEQLRRAGTPSEEGGDAAFGLDDPVEELLDTWARERALEGPLSLLTEDTGWRHFGPDGQGGVVALNGFDHGGARIVVDPIDGTRNLMYELRSAWAVLGAAGPGPQQPRAQDLCVGVLAELPARKQTIATTYHCLRGSYCYRLHHDADQPAVGQGSVVHTGVRSPADHGFYPFFRYEPEQRPLIAQVEAAFFERLAEHEGAAIDTCWDDQYISSGGQIALLIEGHYRQACDLRAHLGRLTGHEYRTALPYDLAGALVCAQAAGVEFSAEDGSELDFPLDTKTPVGFLAWTNMPTRRRLEKHLRAVLDGLEGP